MAPQTVLHLITGLETGGAEMMLERLATCPALGGVRQVVVSMTSLGPVGERLVAAGVPVEALGMGRGEARLAPVRRLVGILRRERPAVVQTWMYHANLLGAVAGALTRTPVVWSLHNSTLEPGRSKDLTIRVNRVCAVLSHLLPRAIVSCSMSSARLHARIGYSRRRMVVIPNGFDTGVHAPSARARQAVRRELGIPFDARVITLVARVDPQKDHPGFFSAAGELSRLGVDAHFLLAGDGAGPENGELRELARRAGVEESTRFLGRRSDVADLLAASDLATLSSAYGESFPLVLGEAMACGVPCVATDLGDCRALVGRTGEIVPPRDPVALAAAWHRLLSSPEGVRAQRGRAARQRVLRHFELSLVARQYRRIWSVAARGGPAQASGLRTIR